jgi:hypothetical protein
VRQVPYSAPSCPSYFSAGSNHPRSTERQIGAALPEFFSCRKVHTSDAVDLGGLVEPLDAAGHSRLDRHRHISGDLEESVRISPA